MNDAAHAATANDSVVVDAARPRRDAGFTIVENLMAIILMGLVASSLFFAMWALIRATAINDVKAEVEAVLGGAVDSLSTVAYQPCPGLEGYEPYAQRGAATVGWSVGTVQVTGIRYWDPFSSSWTPTNPLNTDECNGLVFLSNARTMQLVEVTATSPNGAYTRTVETIVTDLRDRRIGD